MPTTNIFDGLLKLFNVFFSIYAGLQVTGASKNHNAFLMIAAFAVAIPVFLLVQKLIFQTFSCWLYLRFKLKMDVSFDEAKLLRKTISPLFLIKPYPTYTEVKALDPNVRLSTALKMQENWLAKELNTKKLKWLLFNQMSMKSHIILILYFVFFIASLIFCLLNYPPACYITNFLQKNIGHSDEIFMLTWLIFIIPITLIIRKIDRSLKHLI